MNPNTINWHKNLLADFSELGVCYQNNSLPINPLHMSFDAASKISIDLPKIANLARKISIYQFEENINYLRSDYINIIKLYKNKQRLPIIMRPDGIMVDDQLKLIEINIDSAIGGIWEMDFLQNRFKENPYLENYKNYKLPNPKDEFLNFIREIRDLIETKGKKNLALIGYSDFNQFYKDQGEDISQWITENTDFNAYFVIPESLRKAGDYISDGVRTYDVLYRDGSLVHSPKKVHSMLHIIQEASQTKTIVLSDPIDLLIEHKGILAKLYDCTLKDNDMITEDEKNLIINYVPWTKIINNEKVFYQEELFTFNKLLTNKKDFFVIKKCCSHAGEHVYIGAEIDNDNWNNLIFTSLNDKKNQWVVQENLRSNPYKFKYFLENETVIEKEQPYVLSPFIFGNRFGGSLVRIEHNSKKRVLSLPTSSEMGAAGVIYT